MKKFTKQPREILDYDIDASEWLTEGDNITGAEVIISPTTSLTLNNKVVNDDRVKIWLSSGETGNTYKVTTVITTEDGRAKEIDFQVAVKDV